MRKVRATMMQQLSTIESSKEKEREMRELALVYKHLKKIKATYEESANGYLANQELNEPNAKKNKKTYERYKIDMKETTLTAEHSLIQFILGTHTQHVQDMLVSYVLKGLESDNLKCLKATNVEMTLRIDATCEGICDWVKKPLRLKDVGDWYYY